ncbi:mannose-6-phosphate isomerase, class I [Sporolactobacillus kofuensis]|uniref:Mannose-6-phosphate isomerase n=1 Tax=Sporolactobacillus kofuensis TaxID=269672 RepID=A0ABW1WBI4_9BACL|nr:mannose-6-phosphate isomerase, class I [Sporolactobacillus kofuensis]MCO7175034.1 mannose-6-phosphate isomerase, class I [Sporolactobacillus kofuensis]
MDTTPLFLEPALHNKIWGGTRLRDLFGYKIPSETTGECWGISAHPNGPAVIKNGSLAGQTLADAWAQHREFFDNYEGDDFPLLTKILDARTDLSVQVHPDDAYAQAKEHVPFGKTECWYIIDCDEGAEIVYGHTAPSREAFRQAVEEKKWDSLLRRVKVKPGDFFYVPSGTIHAIGGGCLILETQQSSDTTYRVYDYDRPGADGKLRELHIQQSIEVSNCPHRDPKLTYHVRQEAEAKFTELLREDLFTVSHWEVRGHTEPIQKNWPFLLVSVLDGQGKLQIEHENYELNKGDHLVVPASVKSLQILGTLDLIVSSPV